MNNHRRHCCILIDLPNKTLNGIIMNKSNTSYNHRERSHMTSARFWQILPPSPPCQQLSALGDPPPPPPPPPDDVSISQTPPPFPFQSDISFSKNSLHSTLIETLNVYLILLKTERCQKFSHVVSAAIQVVPY